MSVEWATEWVVYTLRRWAFVDLLSIAGSFALLATLVTYCRGADERVRAQQDARKARQFQAWQVITNAQGKPGNGGRTQALQDLAGDSVDLSGVDISGAWLEGVMLPGATLRHLKADSTNLRFADLRGANLENADLRRADLSSADLRGADLAGARLSGSTLVNACLDDANLSFARIDSAFLMHASLRRVQGVHANFWETFMPEAQDLDSAFLLFANLNNAIIDRVPRSATLYGAWFVGTDFEKQDSITAERELRAGGGRAHYYVPQGAALKEPKVPPWNRPPVDKLAALYPRRFRVNGQRLCRMPREEEPEKM